jgi:hypothetical protein
MNTPKLLHAVLSEPIIGAAMKVLNTLKPVPDMIVDDLVMLIQR